MNEEREKPYGLMLEAARPAGELETGQIIVLNGHVLAIEPDPNDERHVRLTLVRALGPPGKTPDQREIELICPRDMIFATAQPHNIDLAPLPPRS
jgi:hypothetical protein